MGTNIREAEEPPEDGAPQEAQKTQLPPEGGRAGEADPASRDVQNGSALQIAGGLAAELGS